MRCVRKGFDRDGRPTCQGCFEKDVEIDRLKEKVRLLECRIRGREKAIKTAGVFGNSTPSSQIPIKESTLEENRAKRGGARLGHKGAGRSALQSSESNAAIELPMPEQCPECDVKLHAQGANKRTLVNVNPIKAERVLYSCERGRCPRCFRVFTRKPQALAKTLYGNELVAQAATMHYVHGIPIGRILEVFGPQVTEGGLIQAFHRLGQLCKTVMPSLVEDYRRSPVKHADETGWRTDGERGYTWVFCSKTTTILQFQETRGASVAQKILGQNLKGKRLPGVLVVDRYGGYNKVNCEIQYCYAHLLREVEKLAEEFPFDQEVVDFSERMASCVALAIKLRKQDLSREQYSVQAQELKVAIKRLARVPSRHLGVRDVQRIFTEKEHRLFHWVRDRNIPADNNAAEREIRPTVVARKTSYGSQSEQGAKTRSHVMSVLYTAKKRLGDTTPVETWLKNTLNHVAINPLTIFANLLPKNPQPSTPGD